MEQRRGSRGGGGELEGGGPVHLNELGREETTSKEPGEQFGQRQSLLNKHERDDLVDELMRKVSELRSAERPQSAAELRLARLEALEGCGELDGPRVQAGRLSALEAEHQRQTTVCGGEAEQLSSELQQQQQQAVSSAQQIARHLSQQAHQQQSQSALENYLMRQRQQAALEQQFHCLRTVSSCSNESSASSTGSGRYSSLAVHPTHGQHHFLLEPSGLDHLMDCSQSGPSPVCGQQAANRVGEAGGQSAGSSPSPSQLFARLSRQLRLLESPCDSGLESGKENGSQSALGFSAACFSPVQAHEQLVLGQLGPHAVAQAQAQAHAQAHMRAASALGQHAPTSASQWAREQQERLLLHQQQGALKGSQQVPTGNRRQHVRPASAIGQVRERSASFLAQLASAGAAAAGARAALAGLAQTGAGAESAARQTGQQQQQQAGSIDDMPMLKRALQAPPLINTNMLMDEAYRHHKKFRASQRAATSCGSHPSSQLKPSSTCASSRASSASSPHSAAPSPSPASSPPPPPAPSSCAPTRLADMHSTLLEKLAQKPARVSERQLKCNDLISEMMRAHPEPRPRPASEPADDSDDELGSLLAGEPAGETPGELAGESAADGGWRARVASGLLAPACSPASAATSPPTCTGPPQPEQLHRILLSGVHKQQQQQQHAHYGPIPQTRPPTHQHRLLGNLSHHLVDEEYIARRLLNSGALKRHQSQLAHPKQQHHHPAGAPAPAPQPNPTATPTQSSGPAGAQGQAAAGQNAAAPKHRPASSSCGSSSSPSPTSSLSSTLSPSPSCSMSPDLELMGAHHHEHHHHHHEHHSQLLLLRAAADSRSSASGQLAVQQTLGHHHHQLGGGEATTNNTNKQQANFGGNFGLLADVALAELEQRQQQQLLVAQPIDLSKK